VFVCGARGGSPSLLRYFLASLRLGALASFVNLVFNTLVLKEPSEVSRLEKFEILKRLINVDINFRNRLHQSRYSSLRFLWVANYHWLA
jgi:hypothetical protein